jgi:hypothetical protein
LRRKHVLRVNSGNDKKKSLYGAGNELLFTFFEQKEKSSLKP